MKSVIRGHTLIWVHMRMAAAVTCYKTSFVATSYIDKYSYIL